MNGPWSQPHGMDSERYAPLPLHSALSLDNIPKACPPFHSPNFTASEMGECSPTVQGPGSLDYCAEATVEDRLSHSEQTFLRVRKSLH